MDSPVLRMQLSENGEPVEIEVNCLLYMSGLLDGRSSLREGGVDDMQESMTAIRCKMDVYRFIVAVWKASLKISLVGNP